MSGGHGGHHEVSSGGEGIKIPDTAFAFIFILMIALAMSGPLFANEAGRLL